MIRFEFLKSTDAPFDKAPLLREPAVPEDARRPPSDLVGESTLEGGFRESAVIPPPSRADLGNGLL